MNVDLIVASEQPPPFDMGDRYIEIDCSDPVLATKSIVALGDNSPIDGVVAADDSGVDIAAMSGRELGVLSNRPEAARATRDKALMRSLLAGSETPQPEYRLVEPMADPSAAAADVGFPVVIKPLDRSASQGVIRVDDPIELEVAVATTRSIIGSEARLLVEEFMAGTEVAIEGLVSNGELTSLAILDKPDMGEGPYFPETILVTPTALDTATQTEALRVGQAAVSGLGLSHGPVHIELKVTDRRVRVIEVAARSIGGLCSQSLRFGLTGTTLETLILRNALGLDKPELKRERSASGVLMIPIPRNGVLQGVTGVKDVLALNGVTSVDVTIRPGTPVAAPPHGDAYLGFVFAEGPNRDDVVASLRLAAKTINVEIK